MYKELSVPISYSGIIFSIITISTIFSTLTNAKLNTKFGTALIITFSTLLTALSLFGFYFSHSFISLCLLAIPYILGAGCIDICNTLTYF